MKLPAIFVAVAICFAVTGEAAVTTTKKPVTTSPTTKSFKVCSEVSSNAASGSIQPLDGLIPAATGSLQTCNFSINAPVGQQVQLSCSVASLSTLKLSQTGFAAVETNSLIFNDAIDIFQPGDFIVQNRVYTSQQNMFSMTYRVINAADKFNCNWTTTKTPLSTTTDFRWCRDKETSVANGNILTIKETNTNDNWYRMCPFFINSLPGRLTQMYCSGFNVTSHLPLTTFEGAFVISSMNWRPTVDSATASGSRTDLLIRYFKTDQLNCQWKSMTALSTTSLDVNLCLRGLSTALNGTIQPLTNLLLTAGQSKWCLFSIIVPVDKNIQVSCSLVNLTSNYSYLMFDGVSDVPTPSTGLLPSLNRVYTSINNRIDVATSYVNGDAFNCNWKAITIPATTSFTLCYHGETNVTGKIQSNTTTTAVSRACRFTITAPSTKHVQFNCPIVNSPDNMLLEYDTFGNNNILASPIIAQTSYTSTSNEITLYAVVNAQKLNCNWIFV